VFFGAAANIVGMACLESAISEACNDVSAEHYVNIKGLLL